ncbi:tRNA-intron lyase [Candidatus Pacearchaeota archaeon CG10_big_fil_rev_8_21_14_0_10_31_9]|nr:MAG: tRNA-intron lyase [Candidatus Pacearchaeota archaeon CG1_02_32_21]PIN94778.1 MAG: tRNA-intron lyase [Candidatus Pacearchaeota archaeon CG10_big_fil_rev_8_21_14_0_10_31_9]PIZ83847.1 MAG: tRNA-intron lyase [Candidatus Pacearchaeota archaeon CG_4_10_14_0_2_um_filter_05_32_18]
MNRKKITKSTKVKNSKEIKVVLSDGEITSASKDALDLYSNRLFGEYSEKRVRYSLSEAIYLVDKGKISVYKKTKKLSLNQLIDECKKIDKKTYVKFLVFKDLRDKGYILKTALKFGADFRVYDKGSKPGKEHAKWILYPISESQEMTWHDFSAKNRVAHSTKKNLLIAIVDSEGDITYYEISWVRP